jgi:carboxyl-terminal processing protease
MSWLRAVQIIVLAAAAAGHAAAQPKATLGDPTEPFNIRLGSTFSASGGNNSPRSVESDRQRNRIALELAEARSIINRYYVESSSASPSDVTSNMIEGMLHSLDPHSHFYDARQWTDLLSEQRSGYTGVGATIANFEQYGVIDTYVLSTFPGSPAARAHLRFGDRIVAIDGKKMTGRSSEIVRDEIRGPDGTSIRLTIERAASGRLETITLRRGRVPVPSIPDAYMMRPGVGYIDLSEGFTYTTADDFATAITELKAAGMSSLVIDLRGNGGGIVEQAVRVAERFLPAGTLILTQRGRTAMDNRVWRSGNKVPEQLPLVVLVNEETASASEIVAGALQDNDRALIVGEKTFGKGLVQTVIDLPGSTGLTLTTGRYLTPAGRSIQRDYSGGDLYDYFKHVKQTAGIGKPFFEARTVTDRPVFGGDGIQPDELIETRDLSTLQLSLLDPVFHFAKRVANGEMPGYEHFRVGAGSFGIRVKAGDMHVSDALLTKLTSYITEETHRSITTDDLAKESGFLSLRLRYDLIMAAFGSVSANQVLAENDLQIRKALEALPRAGRLALLAARRRSQGH